MRKAPGSQQMVVSCKCGHAFLAHFLTNVDVRVWSAHLKTLGCPKCGGGHRKLSLGGTLPQSPEVTARVSAARTDRERRAAWLGTHDTGLSSKCIADVMCGMKPSGEHPHDGSDFGRCYRLLELYPAWRARLSEMLTVSPYWVALVPRWNDIEAAYIQEEVAKRRGFHPCYDLMRTILDPVESQDKSVVRVGRMTIKFGASA